MHAGRYLCWIAGWLFLVALQPVETAADPLPRSVLILDQSGGAAAGPFYPGIVAAFRTVINSDPAKQTSIFVEHLDLSRFGGTEYEKNTTSYLRKKYSGKQIGVIVALGDGALRYVLGARNDLWPEVPVVFTMVEEGAIKALDFPPGITGITHQLQLSEMVRAARLIVPELAQIVLVGERLDQSVPYRHFTNEIPVVVASGLRVTDLTGLTLREMRERVAQLSGATSIIYTAMYSDGEGTYLTPADVLKRIAEVANRPVITNVDSQVGLGGVGGFVLSRDALGASAASLVTRILDGEKISEIPVRDGNVVRPIFDWRELQRWNVRESTLPPDSDIRFRELNAWDRYRWQIIFIIAAILLQAGLINWLVLERRGRLISEALARDTMAELAQRDRMAAAAQVSASIAHEVLQPVTGMVASANAGLRWISAAVPDVEKTKTMLSQIVTAGHRTAEVVRAVRAIFKEEEKKNESVNINELISEVLGLTANDLNRERIRVELNLASDLKTISGDRVQLQQVLLNLINNAVDSMQSVPEKRRMLRIRSKPDGANIQISVEDSGSGVNTNKLEEIFKPLISTKVQGMGLGLAICRSIVEAHDGKIWASPSASRGLTIDFQLPVEATGT